MSPNFLTGLALSVSAAGAVGFPLWIKIENLNELKRMNKHRAWMAEAAREAAENAMEAAEAAREAAKAAMKPTADANEVAAAMVALSSAAKALAAEMKHDG
ncbi:unnamed protein product [Rhodiola kirilowii]